MTPTKTLCGESHGSPAAPAGADDMAVTAQYGIYCQGVYVCVFMGVWEIAPKTEVSATKRQICFGVRDVPTVTCLSARKECILWTSFMSWASPKVKYATSLPASAAAMSWSNAEKGILLVLLVLVVIVFIVITQFISITLHTFKVSLHHVRKQTAKITIN